jgi:hypothetical protein
MSNDNVIQLPGDAPALAAELFIKSIQLPKTTFAKMIREGNGPRMFMLGRRRYITHEDGQAWIGQMREKFAYVKRTNNKRIKIGTE